MIFRNDLQLYTVHKNDIQKNDIVYFRQTTFGYPKDFAENTCNLAHKKIIFFHNYDGPKKRLY